MLGNILAEPVPEHRQLPVRLGARGHADGRSCWSCSSSCGAGSRCEETRVSIRRHPVSALLARRSCSRSSGCRCSPSSINSFNQDTLMAGWGGATGALVRPGAATTTTCAQGLQDDADHRDRLGARLARRRRLGRALVAPRAAARAGGLRRPRLRAHHRARGRLRDGALLPLRALPLPARAARDHHRPLGLELGLRDAHHPGADGRPRPVGRGGGGRSRRDAVARLPPRHAASRCMPAIIAAGLLAFTFSFDDVVTSFFLQGTSQTRPCRSSSSA